MCEVCRRLIFFLALAAGAGVGTGAFVAAQWAVGSPLHVGWHMFAMVAGSWSAALGLAGLLWLRQR